MRTYYLLQQHNFRRMAIISISTNSDAEDGFNYSWGSGITLGLPRITIHFCINESIESMRSSLKSSSGNVSIDLSNTPSHFDLIDGPFQSWVGFANKDEYIVLTDSIDPLTADGIALVSSLVSRILLGFPFPSLRKEQCQEALSFFISKFYSAYFAERGVELREIK